MARLGDLLEAMRTAPQSVRFADQLKVMGDRRVWRYSQYYSVVFGGYVGLALWMTKYYVGEYGFDMKLAAFLATVDVGANSYTIRNSQIRDALKAPGVDYYTLTQLNGSTNTTADVMINGYTAAMVGTIVWS